MTFGHIICEIHLSVCNGYNGSPDGLLATLSVRYIYQFVIGAMEVQMDFWPHYL